MSDSCLSFKIDKNGDRLECVVFVDGLLVVSKCMRMIKVLKAALEARFNNNIDVATWDWNVTSYVSIDVQYDRDKHILHMNVAPKLKKIFEELLLLDELTPIGAIYPADNAIEVPPSYLKYVSLLLNEYRSSWVSSPGAHKPADQTFVLR